MPEAGYAAGPAQALSRKINKRRKRILNNIFCDMESKTLGAKTPHIPTCSIPCNPMRPIYVAAVSHEDNDIISVSGIDFSTNVSKDRLTT